MSMSARVRRRLPSFLSSRARAIWEACSGVLRSQNTTSANPWRRSRWWSTLAKPRSVKGRDLSCSTAASTGTSPEETFPSRSRIESSYIMAPPRRSLATEDLVQRPGPVPCQVGRDVGEAKRLHLLHHALADAIGGQKRDAREVDLDARGAVVVEAQPDVLEAEARQEVLALVDGGDLLAGDRLAVRGARGQAGPGGHVPGRQAELARQRAHLELVELGFEKRAADG